jgi:hypothetical protein
MLRHSRAYLIAQFENTHRAPIVSENAHEISGPDCASSGPDEHGGRGRAITSPAASAAAELPGFCDARSAPLMLNLPGDPEFAEEAQGECRYYRRAHWRVKENSAFPGRDN